MTNFDLTIRRLEPADAAVFREIRLDGMRAHPQSFGSDLAMEIGRPVNWFAERLGTSVVFGGFRIERIVGVAGLATQPGTKKAHKGLLWGVYVRAEARRIGIARQLIEAALDLARTRVELVQLSVESGNEPARRLYSSMGFVEYGLERNALKIDGRYYDDVLMALDLR